MLGIPVDLGYEVGFVWSKVFPKTLLEKRKRYPFLPDLRGIAADLSASGHAIQVPARVEGEQKDDPLLRLYIEDCYVLRLRGAKNGRGYSVVDIWPLSFEDHDKIAGGVLLLCAGVWRLYDHPGAFPRELGNRWESIRRAWNARRASTGAPEPAALPETHSRFLARLEALIEEARRLEAETNTTRLSAYRKVTASAARRRSAKSVHHFQIVGLSRLTVGARVHIEGEPDMRGRVERIEESLALVRFEGTVDFKRIPDTGAFVETPNLVSYAKRREAIELLREGGSRNPALLPALVDGSFQRFRVDEGLQPAEHLDPTQTAAFRKAVAVPDLALVQGPPGTGKTRTIRQIVRACAADRRKVLVTSYNNRAVDNVLKELPDDLQTLRIGREDSVTEDCEHLTLEACAVELQKEILVRTKPVVERFALADPKGGAADSLFRQLTHELRETATTSREIERSARVLAEREMEITTGPRQTIARLTAMERGHREALDARERSIVILEGRWGRVSRMAVIPLLGRLFRRKVERLEEVHAAESAQAEGLRREHAAVVMNLRNAERELGRIRSETPELARLRQLQADAVAVHRSAVDRTARVAGALREVLGGPLPPVAVDVHSIKMFYRAAESTLHLMRRRFELVVEWRERLARRTEQLYPELVRYADVIGATCIGSATNAYLKDVEFNLVIVDEAGQISMPDVLVPLVKAERAVLVGDHLQLPPLSDKNLVSWALSSRPDDTEAITRLVTESAFEIVFPLVPDSHRELLRFQRRMPELIARFVSAEFYNRQLQTAVERQHRDEIFASPMAFVDTSLLPQRKRREIHPESGDRWSKTSYYNQAEAEMITLLAAHYHARHGDWAVILPYSAQIGLVTDLLAERIGDQEMAARRINTLDSFQGGEHDTIIFGFTRSNSSGKVGFFSDVRRTNVAISRAKQRLIMVGDLSTLLNAENPRFRAMAESLYGHLQRSGDLRDYSDVWRQLEGDA